MLYFFEEDACTELLCSLAGHAISTGVPLAKDIICIYIYDDDLWHVPLGKNWWFYSCSKLAVASAPSPPAATLPPLRPSRARPWPGGGKWDDLTNKNITEPTNVR